MSGISPTAGVSDFITELEKISAQSVATSWPAMPQTSCNVSYLIDEHLERTSQGVPCKGYRPDVQLRLFEALSQIPLQELMFSVEDGKFIRDPVIRATRNAKCVHRSDLKPHDVIKARQWFKVLWQPVSLASLAQSSAVVVPSARANRSM